MLDQCLQEWRHVASQCFRIDIVALRERLEDLADTARLGEHVPDFGCHCVEAEIRAGAYAQDNGATIEVGRSRLHVLNKNAIDRDAHSCQAPLLRGEDEALRNVLHVVALRHPANALDQLDRWWKEWIANGRMAPVQQHVDLLFGAGGQRKRHLEGKSKLHRWCCRRQWVINPRSARVGSLQT